MAGSAPHDVRRYYDENTASFLRLGQGSELDAIRRAVWGPGVERRDDAMQFVEVEIEKRIRSLGLAAPEILDLGCGVCSALCRMAEHLPITGTGVTISSVQVEWAKRIIAKRRLGERVRCVLGDYTELPPAIGPSDVAFAIESFIHGPDPRRFFRESARALKPGGLLIICDDFLASDERQPDAVTDRWLRRFADGWHANTLLTSADAAQLARAEGFELEETVDLSSFLELGRLRDRAVSSLMWLFGERRFQSTYWRMLQGGDALQTCLRRGWLKYLFMVLTRRAEP
jgi:SAM-dependent methyltransferase